MKALLCDAAKKLTGQRRRAFMANVTVELPGGRAWRAESQFGWNRRTVELGLHERTSGIAGPTHENRRGLRWLARWLAWKTTA